MMFDDRSYGNRRIPRNEVTLNDRLFNDRRMARADFTLNERLSDLLEQAVEEYIKTATPIASGTISNRLASNDLHRARSPATIRNDLKILEELGFLHQVHAASGGRIPTSRAYDQYIQKVPDPTFVAGLIDDLQQLSQLIARIERKLGGSVDYPLIRAVQNDLLTRKINFQKLFDEPELQMSAIYLIIKEKINGKM